ncbi:MAG: hypothetical protein AAB895_04330 [Patescibacteria group bacterium]
MSQAARDDNRVPTIIGVDSIAFTTPKTAAVDGTTHELLVQATGTVSVSALTTIYNGSKTVATGTATALASTQAINSVTIKALSTNTVSVYVGASGVTTSTGFELSASDSISLDVNDLATVFLISGTASQVVRYIAI